MVEIKTYTTHFIHLKDEKGECPLDIETKDNGCDVEVVLLSDHQREVEELQCQIKSTIDIEKEWRKKLEKEIEDRKKEVRTRTKVS